MSKLKDKIAVITGGTTGMGLATAKRFAAEGATVIVTGRNPKTLDAAREILGDSVEVMKSDAARDEDIVQLVESIKAKHGRIDVLFLNAGIALFAPLEQASVDDFDSMWRVNVRGPWLMLQKALPLLSEGASVIFTTSIADQKGMPGIGSYAATKGALQSIVRVAAVELAARKIRVNAIAPGPIETPIFSKLGMPAEAVDQMAEEITSKIPLARFGDADEIATVAVFLAGSDSSYMTGGELNVGGGYAVV